MLCHLMQHKLLGIFTESEKHWFKVVEMRELNGTESFLHMFFVV